MDTKVETEKTILAECKLHGSYDQTVFADDRFGTFKTPCPKCMEERESKAALRGNSKILQELRRAGIPVRFSESSIQEYLKLNKSQERASGFSQAYVERWDRVFKNGTSLIFCGLPGTGKTHLATAILKEVIRKGARGMYVQARKMTRQVKSVYSTGGSESEEIKRYVKPDILVVDEVGKQFDTDSEKGIMFEVLNDRYNEMKPTIIVSNMTEEGLSEFLGPETVDRLCENGGQIISMIGDSFRRKS